jgi:hypothetical protein
MPMIYPAVTKSVQNVPGLAAQATVSSEAPAPGNRIIVDSICARVTGAAAGSGNCYVVLRDGASGAGAVIWQAALSAPINGGDGVAIVQLGIPTSAGNVATLEFTAAGGAGTQESVAMTYRREDIING